MSASHPDNDLIEVKATNARTTMLMRRLMAMVYDAFLMIAIMFAISAVAVAVNRGQAVSHPFDYLIWAIVPPCFYGWFWTHGGQTLGMSAWKLKLHAIDGGSITLKAVLHRLLWAVITLIPFGVGFIWLLFDRDKRTLYGRLSSTRIDRLPS